MINYPAADATSWELTPDFAWGRELLRGSLLGLAVAAVLLLHQRFDPGFELIDDDAISSWQPIFTDFARQLGEGHLPVWSHHTSCGYPLLGWPQPSFTYPPMWLAHGLCRLIDFEAGEFYLTTLLHAFLAALTSFLYLRRFGVHPLAATAAALANPLSGILLGLGSCWPTYFYSAACWPLVFLTLEELRRQPSWRWTLLLGLIGGVSLLCVDLMLMMKFSLLSGLYFVLRIERATFVGNLRAVAIAAALALLIGQGQLAPSLEIIATSARMGMGSNTFYAAPPQLWLGFVYPFWTLPWEAFSFSATRAAGGFFVGPCVLLGVLFAIRWFLPMRGPHRALLILAAVYLGFGLGNLWYPNELLQRLPGFSAIRWPFRWLFEASCVLSLLSGLGLHLAWRDLSAGRGRSLVLAFVLIVGGVILMRWPMPSGLETRSTIMSVVWAATLAGLWLFAKPESATSFLTLACGWTVVALIANIPVAQQTKMAYMMRLLDQPLDVGSDTQERILFLARHGELVAAQKEGNLSRLFPHRFGTRSVLGYVYRPPSQAWMTGFELDGLIYENERDLARRFLDPDSTMLATLRVGHVVVFKTNKTLVAACAENPELRLERETEFYRIYRNLGFKEPAFFVRELRPSDSVDDLIELGVRVPMPDAALVTSRYQGPTKFADKGTIANFLEHHGNISFDADAPKDGFVVVTTTYFPRWRGSVDGVETPLVRVNGSFIGLQMPAGKHAVRLEYWPADHVAYLCLSAVALVATCVGCVIAFRKAAASRVA